MATGSDIVISSAQLNTAEAPLRFGIRETRHGTFLRIGDLATISFYSATENKLEGMHCLGCDWA